MISLSEEPQFSAQDIYEIPAGVGRTSFEFDTNLIKACHPLFLRYPSNELLAKDLIRAGVILKSDMNLSTRDALMVRFRSQKASLSFIKRLNICLHKCYLKQRDCEREMRLPQKEHDAHQVLLCSHAK